jgi:hypothetical protein
MPRKCGNMCLFLMVPIFFLSLIGVNLSDMPLLEWHVCAGNLCISTGFIVTEMLTLWAKWSKQAEEGGVVDYSYVGEEISPEILARLDEINDAAGYDHLDERHLRDKEDPRVEIWDDFFGGMTQEEIDRYIDNNM